MNNINRSNNYDTFVQHLPSKHHYGCAGSSSSGHHGSSDAKVQANVGTASLMPPAVVPTDAGSTDFYLPFTTGKISPVSEQHGRREPSKTNVVANDGGCFSKQHIGAPLYHNQQAAAIVGKPWQQTGSGCCQELTTPPLSLTSATLTPAGRSPAMASSERVNGINNNIQTTNDNATMMQNDRKKESGESNAFPYILMTILDDERCGDTIRWLPHGRGFAFVNKQKFARDVMPEYFANASKFTSITRRLNRWNFVRVTRGPESGAYYHPQFVRGKRYLLKRIRCLGSKVGQQMDHMDPVALGLTSNPAAAATAPTANETAAAGSCLSSSPAPSPQATSSSGPAPGVGPDRASATTALLPNVALSSSAEGATTTTCCTTTILPLSSLGEPTPLPSDFKWQSSQNNNQTTGGGCYKNVVPQRQQQQQHHEVHVVSSSEAQQQQQQQEQPQEQQQQGSNMVSPVPKKQQLALERDLLHLLKQLASADNNDDNNNANHRHQASSAPCCNNSVMEEPADEAPSSSSSSGTDSTALLPVEYQQTVSPQQHPTTVVTRIATPSPLSPPIATSIASAFSPTAQPSPQRWQPALAQSSSSASTSHATQQQNAPDALLGQSPRDPTQRELPAFVFLQKQQQ